MINIAILSKQRNNFLYEFISKELFKENYEYRIIKTAKLDELVDKKKNYEIVIIDLDDTSYPGNSIAKELYFFNKEIIIIFVSNDKYKRYNSYFLNVYDFIDIKDIDKLLLKDIKDCFKLLIREYVSLKTAGNNITLFKQKNIKYIKYTININNKNLIFFDLIYSKNESVIDMVKKIYMAVELGLLYPKFNSVVNFSCVYA